MRKNPTETEDLIWQEIRNKKLDVKFRRQHIIDKYIVDFACIEKSIIVEIDGGIHRIQIDEDKERQEFLESKGFEFLRFTDIEVLKNKEAVIKSIKSKI